MPHKSWASTAIQIGYVGFILWATVLCEIFVVGYEKEVPDWIKTGSPPPGWRHRIKRLTELRKTGGESRLPDNISADIPTSKYDDQWTVSPKFKSDLLTLKSVITQV